jgi:hypothetical protein
MVRFKSISPADADVEVTDARIAKFLLDHSARLTANPTLPPPAGPAPSSPTDRAPGVEPRDDLDHLA